MTLDDVRLRESTADRVQLSQGSGSEAQTQTWASHWNVPILRFPQSEWHFLHSCYHGSLSPTEHGAASSHIDTQHTTSKAGPVWRVDLQVPIKFKGPQAG